MMRSHAMIRFTGTCCLAAALLGGSLARADNGSITEAGITLKSVAVSFPSSDAVLPGGDQAQVVAQNCTACHSPGMILTQPPLSAATWRDEVNKMINVYKAPVSAEDVPAIVAYLVEHKGTK